MRYSSSILALFAPLLVSAAPRFYGKRAAVDILVFQFANILEQLESTFYSQALQKFSDSDFTTAGFSSSALASQQFTVISNDESTHTTVIQSALTSAGATPIICEFSFDSVLTDVSTMAAVARVVENTGVAAYLGGLNLMTDVVLLDAAATILTVEARHQTILNIASGSGTAIPAAFDIALTPSEVLAIASPFITSCNADLGITANPTLTITNTGTVSIGTLLTFSSTAINSSTSGLFCQMLVGGNPFSIPLAIEECVVPSGINGPVAIFITSDNQPLLADVHDRASSQLIAGPTIAFIDSSPELLGQLIRTGTSSADTSSITSTITNEEASAIIASAASTAAASAPTSDSSGAISVDGSSSNSTSVDGSSSNSTSVDNSAPGGPNEATGPSANGQITVNGWSDT